jgi:beta-lactamase superfamily II metal-dependent hydrolase
MPLDIYIHGPAFGEMILLRWEEDNEPRAALMDVHCPASRLDPLLSWLEMEGVHHLAFIAITHPHLDHIRNADGILRAYEGRVDRLWYWPGLNQAAYVAYFNRLARAFDTDELKHRAAAVRDLLEEHIRQFYLASLSRPELAPFANGICIYPLGKMRRTVEFMCTSPWDGPLLEFVKMVSDGIKPSGTVTDTHSKCNLVSGGFLVRHGKAHVLLGGDMETSNWDALRASGSFAGVQPCVVKVSHHGSHTGCLADMWGPDGFLGRHKPVAVITPWNRALPDWAVVEKIRSSGGQVYLTGASRPRVDDGFPHIHLRVLEDASVQVVHKSPSVQRIA